MELTFKNTAFGSIIAATLFALQNYIIGFPWRWNPRLLIWSKRYFADLLQMGRIKAEPKSNFSPPSRCFTFSSSEFSFILFAVDILSNNSLAFPRSFPGQIWACSPTPKMSRCVAGHSTRKAKMPTCLTMRGKYKLLELSLPLALNPLWINVNLQRKVSAYII